LTDLYELAKSTDELVILHIDRLDLFKIVIGQGVMATTIFDLIGCLELLDYLDPATNEYDDYYEKIAKLMTIPQCLALTIEHSHIKQILIKQVQNLFWELPSIRVPPNQLADYWIPFDPCRGICTPLKISSQIQEEYTCDYINDILETYGLVTNIVIRLDESRLLVKCSAILLLGGTVCVSDAHSFYKRSNHTHDYRINGKLTEQIQLGLDALMCSPKITTI
jgi:hypothetical protein